MEKVIEYIDNQITKIIFEDIDFSFDVFYFSKIEKTELIICIFKNGNSIKITQRMFYIFDLWKEYTYENWTNILIELMKYEDKMPLCNFIYFSYQYLGIDFIHFIILFDDNENHNRNSIKYLLEYSEHNFYIPCKGLIKSKMDIEKMNFYNIKAKDCLKIQENLILQGAKKAFKN